MCADFIMNVFKNVASSLSENASDQLKLLVDLGLLVYANKGFELNVKIPGGMLRPPGHCRDFCR